MLPCGDSICLSCFEPLLQPQENKIVCPVDEEVLVIPKKFRDNVTKLLKQKSQLLWILCKDHNDIIAEYFCPVHKAMICHQCAFKTHSDHAKKLEHVTARDVEGFCDRSLQRLQDRKNKIQSLIEQVGQFQLKEKSYTSEQFVNIFREVQDSIIPHIPKEEKNQVELVLKEGGPVIQNDFGEDTLKIFDITEDHEVLLKQWIKGEEAAETVKFELLYKATKDSFNSYTMHEKINNKGPIVAILKSEHTKVFGGYSSIGWKPDGAWSADPNAFIFSLSQKTKHEQYQNKEQAMYFANSFMIWFGYDILIYNDCNNNGSSYSNFGSTYKPPDGMAQGSEDANKYLAGSHSFKVLEIEVFKVGDRDAA